MNFYDLSAKLRAIEESSVAECGDMMPMPMMSHAPQQSDSVTMNVSMNGNGAGGIKDLMSILRNIEQSAEHDHEEPMIARPHSMDGDVDVVLGTADEDMLADPDADESYGNSAPGGSDAHTYGIDSVTRHGDDMHSKGSVKRLRVNGGENPLQEALVERLSAMYQEIKEGERTMSRAAKGNEKYGKDGMRALAKAGREGKDLDKVRDKYNKYDEGFEQMPQNTALTTPNMPTQAPSTFNYSALKSNPEWKKLQANLEAAINAGDPDSPALMKAMQDIKAFTAKMGVPSSK